MPGRLITFTNLFPSGAFPRHGLFVRERMRRVVAAGGFDWVVVCPVPRVPRGLRRGDFARFAEMPEREVVDGVEVWHPPYKHWPGFSMAAQAKRMARASRSVVERLVGSGSAVIDAHYVYPDGVAALRIASRARTPVIVTARGSDINVVAEVPSVRRQIRRWLPEARARFAVSDPLRAKFAVAAGVPDDAVAVCRNGVDLERFAPRDPVEARAELGLPQAGPLALGVGRLVAGKAFHLAAAAMHGIDEGHLVLVGDGPERERIEAAAPPGRVVFLGARSPDEVAKACAACDLFVLPSEREGWPNVVTEALASGLPVVATAVGSVPQMITEPWLGSVVSVGDGVALGREMGRFLKSPPDRSKIRRHAERFSWDEPVATLVETIQRNLA